MLISLFLLFIIIAILNILGEFTPFKKRIRYITTPLIIPTLALYIFSSLGEINPLILIALTCGWIGDIILMLRNKEKRCTFFIWGILIFFIGHIFYMIAFSTRLLNQWRAIEPLSWVIAALVITGAIFHLLSTRKNSGNIFFAVAAYGLILASLFTVSILSFYPKFILTSIFGISGTFFFIVSDIVLSTHQFVKPIKFERPIAMATYIIAQYAIVVSLTGTYPHPWY